MARCFVTRELPGTALDRLRAAHEVEVWPGELPPSRAELIEHAREAEGLLCLLTDAIDAEVIDACPRLRAISNYAVGSDNIDSEAAARRGIEVGVTPDVLTETTADLAFALLLAAARRLPEGERDVRDGKWRTWEPRGWLGHDVHGMTLCIVGMGRIGSAVASRAEAFSMRVVAVGRGDRLHDALTEADFVSIHCPLTDETRGLIGADEFGAMKPTAVLVNTARGPIVQTEALRQALTDGAVAAAALDVTDPEPLPADHPLLAAPNLLVVPHIGSATHATRERMAELAVDNLLASLRGLSPK
ncbi:MAG: D-glycerate dehydrogenase [Actinomycetota bacterium]|nr:D-glycerate dehydrogenase [Actinomycetota bacterium]